MEGEDEKRKPGRKAGTLGKNLKTGRMISLTDAEWDEIDKVAAERGIPRSELIRRLVRIFLWGSAAER